MGHQLKRNHPHRSVVPESTAPLWGENKLWLFIASILRKPRHEAAQDEVWCKRSPPPAQSSDAATLFCHPPTAPFSQSQTARRLSARRTSPAASVRAHPALTDHLAHPQIRAFASGRKPSGFHPNRTQVAVFPALARDLTSRTRCN